MQCKAIAATEASSVSLSMLNNKPPLHGAAWNIAPSTATPPGMCTTPAASVAIGNICTFQMGSTHLVGTVLNQGAWDVFVAGCLSSPECHPQGHAQKHQQTAPTCSDVAAGSCAAPLSAWLVSARAQRAVSCSSKQACI